jgi:hypothetical protein
MIPVITEDGYTPLVVARLFDYVNRHAPWHRALWTIGTALAIDEAAEYSDFTRSGAFNGPQGLQYVLVSAQRMVQGDPGAGPSSLRDGFLAALEEKAARTEQGALTLRHLSARLRSGYCGRIADAIRGGQMSSVETVASLTAAHLLDAKLSPGYLHEWLHQLVKVDARNLDIADILDEADLICSAQQSEFEVCIPLTAIPGGYPGPMPDGWFDSHETAAWLDNLPEKPKGDLRQAGSIRVSITARDPWSAVETGAEMVSQTAARVALGHKQGRVAVKGVGWVAGHATSFPLRASTFARLRAYKTAEDIFRLSGDPEDARIDDVLEIFAGLESGTRGSALTGGWAAVEGLFLRPGESPAVMAADRLAAIVACALPRAMLTALSYAHRPSPRDALIDDLDECTSNLERARTLEDFIESGGRPDVSVASDVAMLNRFVSMKSNPIDKLRNVERYASEAFRRLYTQRNLVMHGGSFRSITLPLTLRTTPKLVAAGIDRVVAHRLDPSSSMDALALAERAKIELSLVGTTAARRLCDLLD